MSNYNYNVGWKASGLRMRATMSAISSMVRSGKKNADVWLVGRRSSLYSRRALSRCGCGFAGFHS